MQLSTIAYVGIILSTLLSVILPIVAVLYLRNKHALWMRPVIVGVLTWLVMTQLFENILHYIVFTTTPIQDHPWWYVVYGLTGAALFEETGRYIAFSTFLKKCREFKDGIGYGLGHGGVESIVIGSIVFIQVYVLANMLQNPEGAVEIPKTPTIHFYLGAFERVGAVIIHIGLSMLVLLSVKQKKWNFFLMAIVGHMLANLPAAMFQTRMIGLIPVYIWIIMCAGVSLLGIRYIYRNMPLREV